MSNASVACPGEAVLFTCSLPGTALRWQVDLLSPAGTSLQSFFLPSQVGVRRIFRSGVIMFEAVLVSNNGGTLKSTLINLSEVSVLDDSNVTCTVTNNGVMSQQQTIRVDGEYIYFIAKPIEILYIEISVVPTRPLNPSVSFIQNQLSSSIITLEWNSPSSTGGVSVSYVLTISPTPLSGSPVTVETTSAQITVSYNTPYNVTIRAVNCAGMSQESLIVDLSKLLHGDCRHWL